MPLSRQIGWMFVLLFVAFSGAPVHAANIVIVNEDGPNEGFNDPTPVDPVPGNPATTLGQQWLNVFEAAAGEWGGILVSGVTIEVGAEMNSLFCDSMSAVLGAAGPVTVHRDFAGALETATWYPAALADSLAGTDLSLADVEIVAEFNSELDGSPSCLGGASWWNGIGSPPEPGTIDFFTTVLHEIGHGLGFTSFVNRTSGEKFLGLDDTYMLNLEDHSLGLTWPGMTNPQRAQSAVDTGDLHWVGPRVLANAQVLSSGLGAGGHPRMYAPSSLQGGSSVAHWDTVLSPNELMEPFLNNDATDLLTTHLMADLGWRLRSIFSDGFESGDTGTWSLVIP